MINLENIGMAVLLTALGQIGHLGMVKIPSLQQKGAETNHPFSLREWWRDDRIYIIAVFSISVAIEIIIEKMQGAKPQYEFWKWAFYGAWGFMLSSIVQKKYSVYEKKVPKIIDVQANIVSVLKDKIEASPTDVAVMTDKELKDVKPTKE